MTPVRRIAAGDWPRWQATRLEMLREAPYAFGTTYAEMAGRDDAFWTARARDLAEGETNALFVAGDFLATAGAYRDDDGSYDVFSVWTRPEARGRGLAERCVTAALAWMREGGATEARLWVTDTNEAARRLYVWMGFAPTGRTQPLPSDPTLTESEYALPL